MGCNAWVCGTGLDEVTTLPGDPSNNMVLSAQGITGGIKISWTYPTTNPYGVSFIKLYRATDAVFSNAIQLANVSASYYLDTFSESEIQKYYYWIQLVSINGTEMAVVGPASATPFSALEETLESLTGRIDSGKLATSLRSEINRITGLASDLDAEKSQNLLRHQIVSEALEASAAANGQAFTYIAHETEERKSETEAIVEQVDLLFASINETQAALLEEKTIRATQDGALASKVDQAEVAFQSEFASVNQTMESSFSLVDGKLTNLGALWTAKVTVNNLIGGFGVYNNGKTVEAGFDVDTFWVGRTNSDKVKPFVISGGTTYINSAIINNASITTLKLAGNTVTVPQSVTMSCGNIALAADTSDWGTFTMSSGTIIGSFVTPAPVDSVNNLIIITGRTGFVGSNDTAAHRRFALFCVDTNTLLWDSGWTPFISSWVAASVIHTATGVRTYRLCVMGRGYTPSGTAQSANIGITILGGKR